MNKYIHRIITHLIALILVLGIFCGISWFQRPLDQDRDQASFVAVTQTYAEYTSDSGSDDSITD